MQKSPVGLIKLLTLIMLCFLFIPGCYKQQLPARTNNTKSVAEINAYLAIYYLDNQLVDLAKYKAIKALNIQPHLPLANLAMARYLAHVEEYKTSEKYFLTAIKNSNQNAKFLHAYGSFICEYNINDFNIAIRYLKLAEEQLEYLQMADLYASISLCYAKNNFFLEARSYLDKAIAHKYNDTVIIQKIKHLIPLAIAK